VKNIQRKQKKRNNNNNSHMSIFFQKEISDKRDIIVNDIIHSTAFIQLGKEVDKVVKEEVITRNVPNQQNVIDRHQIARNTLDIFQQKLTKTTMF
jgi:hypothetical protein